MKMDASNIKTFAMDEDQLKAFVFAHLGPTDDGLDALRKLTSFDRLALGRYALIQFGGEPDMTDEERADAVKQGEEFYDIVSRIENANYFADK